MSGVVYRTGHWGVTIVREAEDCDCRIDESSLNRSKFHRGCRIEPPQLVAVVVTGDVKLAERICALLNSGGWNR